MGNLSEQHDDDGSRYYRYDADNQLIEARIEKAGKPAEVWQYRYDALGRRISKESLNRKTEFIWEGSRLLQEYTPNGVYSYVYTEQGSYEPLAQIFKANGATQNEVLYYHNDQIGVPRELTDAEGNIVWSGEYSGWGKLTNPDNACLKKGVHQPFRLQNQYADEETGLHYNFFRYYDPHSGRFTQQDPIGLWGGDNLYRFGNSTQGWIDLLGLEGKTALQKFDDEYAGTFFGGSATAGLGLAGSCSYAGKGEVSCDIAVTAGAGLEASAGKSKNLIGERKDGPYTEICATIKPGVSVGGCVGSNLKKKAKPYATGQAGVGAGAGLTANIGYQKTFSLFPKAQPQYSPPKMQIPPGVNPNNMHPDYILNNIRF